MAKKDIVTPKELIEAQDARSVISKEMHDDRDLMNQLLGQIQMADAFSKFSETVATSKLAYIKENQLYKNLKGKKTSDGRDFSGTWDDFCQLLNVSSRKVDEDIQNLQSFGEQALESMSKMGIGYRELRQFRKLPEDEKQALIEVAKEGDKEGFAEVAETIIAKHVKEKEKLSKALEDTTANLEAARENAEKYSNKLQKADAELIKVKKHIKDMPPAELGEHIRDEVTQHAVVVEQSIKSLQHALQELTDHGYRHSIDHTPFISGVFGQVSLTLNQLKLAFKLVDTVIDDNPIPKWQRPEALAEAEAAIEALPAIGEE